MTERTLPHRACLFSSLLREKKKQNREGRIRQRTVLSDAPANRAHMQERNKEKGRDTQNRTVKPKSCHSGAGGMTYGEGEEKQEKGMRGLFISAHHSRSFSRVELTALTSSCHAALSLRRFLTFNNGSPITLRPCSLPPPPSPPLPPSRDASAPPPPPSWCQYPSCPNNISRESGGRRTKYHQLCK